MHLKDEKIYISVTINEKVIKNLTECSKKVFKDLKKRGHLSEKQLNYYSFT